MWFQIVDTTRKLSNALESESSHLRSMIRKWTYIQINKLWRGYSWNYPLSFPFSVCTFSWTTIPSSSDFGSISIRMGGKTDISGLCFCLLLILICRRCYWTPTHPSLKKERYIFSCFCFYPGNNGMTESTSIFILTFHHISELYAFNFDNCDHSLCSSLRSFHLSSQYISQNHSSTHE